MVWVLPPHVWLAGVHCIACGLSAHRLAGRVVCLHALVHEVVGPSSRGVQAAAMHAWRHVYYAVCLCSGVWRQGRLWV